MPHSDRELGTVLIRVLCALAWTRRLVAFAWLGPGCGSTTRCKPRLAAAAMGNHTGFDLLAVAAALLVFLRLKLPAATVAQLWKVHPAHLRSRS